MTASPTLLVADCSKQYTDATGWAVASVSFSVKPGESVVLIGESGSGKTTLLRMIAGFETPTTGTISLGDRVLADKKHHVPPEDRCMGMLFQDYALFPHLNVLDNVMFGLHRIPRSQRKDLAKNVLEQVQMLGYEDRYPHTLSGGQQQRVALARALAPQPNLLLLDEPFSNLDILVKSEVRDAIFRIIQQTGISTLSVMHDMEDAMTVADRVILLQQGRLLQMGSPQELYEKPHNSYVARFMGKTNLLPATAVSQGWQTEFGLFAVNHNHPIGTPGTLSIRPEHLEIVDPEHAVFRGTVIRTGFAGRCCEITLQAVSAVTPTTALLVEVNVRSAMDVGDLVYLRPQQEHVIVFV